MSALRLLRAGQSEWRPPVLMVSSLHDQGLDALWSKVLEHRAWLEQSGELERKRRRQLQGWMWSMVDERVLRAVREHPAVAAQAAELERKVLAGELTATLAAQAILHAFGIAGR
jgi:LAO/AO transport system kinase